MTGEHAALTVVVDHDLCAGVAMCLQLAPAAFELDAEGQAVFLEDGDWSEPDLRQAADGCPMEAITVRTGSGG